MPVPEVELSAPLAQAAKLSTVTPWANERCEDGNVEEGKEEDGRLSSRPPLSLRVWRRSGDQRINERRDVCSRDRGLSGKKERVRWAAGRRTCQSATRLIVLYRTESRRPKGGPSLSESTRSFHRSHTPSHSSSPLAHSLARWSRATAHQEGGHMGRGGVPRLRRVAGGHGSNPPRRTLPMPCRTATFRIGSSAQYACTRFWTPSWLRRNANMSFALCASARMCHHRRKPRLC